MGVLATKDSHKVAVRLTWNREVPTNNCLCLKSSRRKSQILFLSIFCKLARSVHFTDGATEAPSVQCLASGHTASGICQATIGTYVVSYRHWSTSPSPGSAGLLSSHTLEALLTSNSSPHPSQWFGSGKSAPHTFYLQGRAPMELSGVDDVP